MAASKGSFKPGQSGNPGGRPKVVGEVVSLARLHKEEAIEALVGILRNKKAPAQARVAAANAILDRGYGKPAQSVDLGFKRESMEEMSDAELQAIAASTEDK